MMNEKHNANYEPCQSFDDELRKEAKLVALKEKPRGNKAREFYSYVASLVEEAEFLLEIEGQEARNRQIEIGKELSLYKFPMAMTMDEYDTGQMAGKWQLIGKQGGEYYPVYQRKADEKAVQKADEENMLNLASKGFPLPNTLDDEIPF